MGQVVSVNPARPDEVVATFEQAATADVDRAVQRARVAQAAWTDVPIPARAEMIAACGELLAGRKGELATLVSREAGKVLVEAAGDVQEAIDMAAFVAGQGRAAWGETVPCEMPDKFAVVRWPRDADVVTIARAILGTLKYEPHTADTTTLRSALERIAHSAAYAA